MAAVNSAIDAVVAMVSVMCVSPREQEDSMPPPLRRGVHFAPVVDVIPEQRESIDVEAMEAEAAAEYAQQRQSV